MLPTSFDDPYIFPAPRPTYRRSDYPHNLVWFPLLTREDQERRQQDAAAAGGLWPSFGRPRQVHPSTSATADASSSSSSSSSYPSSPPSSRRMRMAANPLYSSQPHHSSSSSSSHSPRNNYHHHHHYHHPHHNHHLPPISSSQQKAARPFIPALLIHGEKATHLLIVCHSNGVDLGMLTEELACYVRHWHTHILAVEYCGYGVCPGTASEQSVNDVVMSALAFAREQLFVPPSRIILMGTSIGTGPATRAAATLCRQAFNAQERPAALLLQSPFTSVKDCARKIVGGLALLVSDRFRNIDEIKSVDCPVMVIHGQKDEIVPCQQGRAVFDACPARDKLLITPPEADHNVFQFEEDILKPTAEFLRRYVVNYCQPEARLRLPRHVIETALLPSKVGAPDPNSLDGGGKAKVFTTTTTTSSSSSTVATSGAGGDESSNKPTRSVPIGVGQFLRKIFVPSPPSARKPESQSRNSPKTSSISNSTSTVIGQINVNQPPHYQLPMASRHIPVYYDAVNGRPTVSL